MQSLALALGFLTIFPAPLKGEPQPAAFGRAAALFPLIGLFIGVLLALADYAFGMLWPAGVAAALTLGLAVCVTGALHLDGFLDTCDGLFLWRPERRLEVMRDSRVGGFALAGGLVLYGIKLAALGAIGLSTGPSARVAALVLMPVASRMAMTAALTWFPYARASGAGSPFKDGIRARHGVVAVVTALLVGAVFGPAGTGTVALGLGMALAAGAYVTRRLGGMTGDTYGFVSECVEAAVLLVAASPAGDLLFSWRA